MDQRSRAFIAAPLIGTIVFLTAMVFVVNINKADAAEVKQVVSNAYHNRIVSLLELYRADLGALFRESMGRLIETALAEPSWTLFNVPIYPNKTDHASLTEGKLTQENRLDSCKRVKDVLDAIICADTTKNVVCTATAEGHCEASGCTWTMESTCVPVGEEETPRYGLQEWVLNLKSSGVFEGVLFTPSGEIAGSDCGGVPCTRFDYFIKPQLNPRCRAVPVPQCSYVTNCKRIIPGILFDCANFAKNNLQPFRCCRKYRRGDSIVSPTESGYDPGIDDVCIEPVEGCEHGNFFVQIRIEDPVVFPNLPRLQASDGAGNEIRSGAIADADFLLPVKYPIFLYMDASFRIYDRLAYGNKATMYAPGQDAIQLSAGVGSLPGIVSGLFVGNEAACVNQAPLEDGRLAPEGIREGMALLPLDSGTTPDARETRKGQFKAFAGESFTPLVVSAVEAAGSGFTVRFYDLSGGEFNCSTTEPTACLASASGVVGEYVGNLLSGEENPYPGPPVTYCSFLDRLPLFSQIIDSDPAYRVSMTKPNTYSWMADLRLWEGRSAPPLG
ncbi:MAG: hypothetical protein AB1626_00440 [Candidatus Micrarchaeota archaeon]